MGRTGKERNVEGVDNNHLRNSPWLSFAKQETGLLRLSYIRE